MQLVWVRRWSTGSNLVLRRARAARGARGGLSARRWRSGQSGASEGRCGARESVGMSRVRQVYLFGVYPRWGYVSSHSTMPAPARAPPATAKSLGVGFARPLTWRRRVGGFRLLFFRDGVRVVLVGSRRRTHSSRTSRTSPSTRA